jgi:hypothetical protein
VENSSRSKYKIILATLAALVLIAAAAGTNVYAIGWKTKTTNEGYSFQYPSNWKLEKVNRFHNFDARLVYGNNIVQMNFESGDPIDYLMLGISDESDLTALETASATLFNDGTTFESGTDKYMINNHTAPYAITKFESDPGLFGRTLDMVGMVVLVHLSDSKIALVQYVAEEDDFDKFLPKAEQILESITTTGSNANI